MDDQLGTGGRRVGQSTRFSDIFDGVFAEYLAMGMSYDEFWNMDAGLVKSYRKAHAIKRDERNFEAWNTGRYVYRAIGALAPILRTSLSKQPVKADEYIDKPYPLTKEQAERDELERRKSKIRAMIERMNQESEENRRKREEKEARSNGE